jgi:hypothetical protein
MTLCARREHLFRRDGPDQKGQVRSGCPPRACALPEKIDSKRGAFGPPKLAAQQKMYAISGAPSMG